MNETKMTELTQAENMAYFRADLCIYSPESDRAAVEAGALIYLNTIAVRLRRR